MIKMIIAVGKNGLIGKGSELPWDVKEELTFFQKMTTGHNLLWGERTFENLPKKLINRKHYVLTQKESINGADFLIKSQEELNNLFDKFENSKETLFICGGKSVYEQFYNKAKEIYYTEIKGDFEGDVYIKFDLENYIKKTYLKTDKFTTFLYTKI